MTTFILVVQILFFLYFTLLNTTYLVLIVTAATRIWRSMQEREIDTAPRPYVGLEPEISLLVPAHNEETTIRTNLHSLLRLNYPHYEIIVIDDGSTDGTLNALKEEFSLIPFPEANPGLLKTMPVEAIYRSARYPNLRVIEKQNGGKADALNVGLNFAHSPLYCSIDADSILTPDSLKSLVRPFLNDARTVAAGGTVRIANGCDVRNGHLVRAGMPKSIVALLQIIEYLRGFLYGRLGWVPMNGMLVISGAVGMFDRERVLAVGGYDRSTVGEDMELVVRLHRVLSKQNVDYKIDFVADPVCWTEVPEDLHTLRLQRTRWQRGLAESLWLNRGLAFTAKAAGWLAFPFTLIFELFGPMIELTGYVIMIVLWILGFVSGHTFLIFFLMSIGLGTLLSITAVLLEELSFHLYPKPKHLFILCLGGIVDNLGFRQLLSVWRLWGFVTWIFGKRGGWGKMARKGSWNKTFDPAATRRRNPALR
jgi:cellulose synthase/poly-beta-1,6-N-acetylglucosamine synthase-like glycosyltransferase